MIPAMCTRRWLLGQACKVVVTEDETTVVDGAGKVEQISGRVNQIRNGMAQVGPAGFVLPGRGRCRPHADHGVAVGNAGCS